MTTTGTPVIRSAGEGVRPRPRPAPAITAGLVALAVGLGFGRFVTYGRSSHAAVVSPAPAAVTPAGQDLAKTVASLEAAVQRDPTNATAWQSLGSAYIRRATQGDPTFYDLAQKAFDRADAIAPNQEGTLIGRGALALSRHQFADARAIALRALALQPLDPDALVVKTDADIELGQYAAADADLQRLLSRRPALAVYARVSYFRELRGDIAGAITAMREARVAGAGQALDTADVTNFLGDLEFNSGHAADALHEYDAALALAPGHLLASVGRARSLAALGHVDQAIGELQRLVQRVPLPQAAELLGDLDTARGRSAAAQDAYDLVRAETQLQQASGVVVDLELARFETDHATTPAARRHGLNLARAAYRDRPDNVYAADVLAWARLRAGDVVGARSVVDRALRIGTADAALHFHAASVFAATGETARARSELTFAFHQNPSFTWALRSDATALAHQLGVEVPSGWRS